MIEYNELILNLFREPEKTMLYNPKTNECVYLNDNEVFDAFKSGKYELDEWYSFANIYWELFDAMEKAFIKKNKPVLGNIKDYNDRASFIEKLKESNMMSAFIDLYGGHMGFYLHFSMKTQGYSELEASGQQYEELQHLVFEIHKLLIEYGTISPKLFELEEDEWNHDVALALYKGELQLTISLPSGQGFDAYKTNTLMHTGIDTDLIYSLSNLIYITNTPTQDYVEMHSTESGDGYVVVDYLTEALASSLICVMRKLAKAVGGMKENSDAKKALTDRAFYSIVYIRDFNKPTAQSFFKKLEGKDIQPEYFFYNFNIDDIKPIHDAKIINETVHYMSAGIDRRESIVRECAWTITYLMLFYSVKKETEYCRATTGEPFTFSPVKDMSIKITEKLNELGVPNHIVVDNIFDYKFIQHLLINYIKEGTIKLEYSDSPLTKVRDIIEMEKQKESFGKA